MKLRFAIEIATILECSDFRLFPSNRLLIKCSGEYCSNNKCAENC